MKQVVLRNHLAPGDILMLTAAVRDLHKCYPGEFQTDVRTSCPALWENNPYLTSLAEEDPQVQTIQCEYPLIHRSNQSAKHFLWGFMDHLNELLGTQMHPTAFCGDVHLSASERQRPSAVAGQVGMKLPYWLIVAGGKCDYTIKWWHFRRFQEVVDHFRGSILFVQVGSPQHYHPGLSGVLCWRGKTTVRELIYLVHHADGVLCPVTFLMHLAAAVEGPGNGEAPRACVVVAGGRESPHWEAYPHHQFIHTVGTLPCCAFGGCWRARTVPLGDGDPKDDPDRICLDVVNGLPRCMDMIQAKDVIRRIEYGLKRTLSKAEYRRARPYLTRSHRQVLAEPAKLIPRRRVVPP